MTDDRLTDDDIREMLYAVAADASVGHPHAGELREAVLTEFRSRMSGAPARVGEITDTAAAGIEPIQSDTNVIDLRSAQSGTRSRGVAGARWRLLGVGIAAAVLLVVAVLSQTQPASDQVDTAALPQLTAQTDPTSGVLDAGRYRADGVAGGIDVTLPENLSVTDAGPGFVELQPSDNPWGSSLVVMTADGSLEDLLLRYRDDGLITDIRSVATSADGLVTEFEVRPTNAALTDECRQDATCLAFGVTHLDHDGVNLARQLDGPDGRGIWTLYRSDTANAPFLRDVNAILDSLEFATES